MPIITHFKSFLKLFLQSNCPLCQRPNQGEFCSSCTKQLQKCQLNDPYCLWKQQMPVFAWGAYGGILKRAIAVLKYNNRPEVARPLGQWLGEVWLEKSPLSEKRIVVIPIPLQSNKQKTRGFNQAELIAKSFCETTGFKLNTGLQRVRETQAQHSLSISERETNLADAFEVSKELRRHSHISVLLIDDIYTTGATARSAATTLYKNGITVIGLATIAAGIKSR